MTSAQQQYIEARDALQLELAEKQNGMRSQIHESEQRINSLRAKAAQHSDGGHIDLARQAMAEIGAEQAKIVKAQHDIKAVDEEISRVHNPQNPHPRLHKLFVSSSMQQLATGQQAYEQAKMEFEALMTPDFRKVVQTYVDQCIAMRLDIPTLAQAILNPKTGVAA